MLYPFSRKSEDSASRPHYQPTGHWPSLLSALLHFDVSFMVWVLLGALGNHIAGELGLTASLKGLMTAVPILSGALLRVAVGLLSDRFGARRVGLVTMLVLLAPLLWGWLGVSDFPQILALGLLLGVAGSSFAVALPLASRWYPAERQGLVMGIAGAGNSGTVVAALLAPRLAEAVGWRGVMGLAAIPVLAVAVAFAFLAKDSPQQPSPQHLSSYFQVLQEADIWWFCGLYSITFGGFVGMSSFLAIFFHDQYLLDMVQAGNLMALCAFAGSFFRPVGGYLADRIGGVKVLVLMFLAAGLLLLGVSRLPAVPMAVAFLFLGLACLGMGNGAVFQLVPQRFGRYIGAATGVVGAAGGVGGFLFPTLIGLLKDFTGSYGTGFLILSVAAFQAGLLLLALYQGWRSTWLARGELVPVLVAVEEP